MVGESLMRHSIRSYLSAPGVPRYPGIFILRVAILIGMLSGLVQANNRPNIVVFLTDDLGQLDSQPYGSTDVRTPHMQRLAESGLTFTHAFIASPACAPSRAALLTGLMPARNGAEANHTNKRNGIASLTERLKSLGYEIAAFGKVAHGKDGDRHGFDLLRPKHDAETIRGYLTSRDTTKPLCLFVGTHEPHVPWLSIEGYDPEKVTLPPTFLDTPETREFRARYYTDVTKADTELGEIRELTNELLGKDSLFVFSSDHGAQWPFGKWNLYDAGIRVPLIVSWPGVIQPNSRTSAMVQWTDILPTLIDAAKGEAPNNVDGLSFLSVLQGKADQHREEIFTTHSGDGRMNVYPIRSIRTQDWKLIWNLHPEFAYTTHIDKALAKDGGRYWVSWFDLSKSSEVAKAKVQRYHQRPQYEFYDLVNDPFEQTNLIDNAAHSERIADLQQRLEKWMEEQKDQKSVFQPPRLLSDPASTQPADTANLDNGPSEVGKK
jgi:N-sulfoglucosamine sulfohydrolase